MKWLPLLLLTGCMSNNGLGSAAMSQDNIWNLTRISIGMNESQVIHVMHHPYMKRSFENDGNVYHIWFYVTRPVGLDQSRLVRQNLTPLTFENGVLLGWGFDFYHHIIRKIEKPVPSAVPQKPKEDQNKSIEKTIDEIEKTPQSKKRVTPVTSEQETQSKVKEAKSKKKKAKENSEENPDPPLNEGDEKMIDEENEQNFNFW